MGSSVVLLGDQLPVPSQQGLRCDNAGDLGKGLSSQRFGLYGQSPALIVIEVHSPTTELFAKHPVLLAKIFHDLQLVVVHPPGDSDQQKPEWVEHSLCIQNPLSQPPSRSGEISHLHADPVFGSYAIDASTFCRDLDNWPRSWLGLGKDLPPGEALVVCFRPLIEHLAL